MNLHSRIQLLEAVVDSWQPPPEPPLDELRKEAQTWNLPLERVLEIWRKTINISPEGIYGDALLFYIHELRDAQVEHAGQCDTATTKPRIPKA